MSRIVMIGGRNNWRTHVPKRPVTLSQEAKDSRWLLWGALAALILLAPQLWSAL